MNTIVNRPVNPIPGLLDELELDIIFKFKG